MTLSVFVYVKNADGEEEYLTLSYPFNDLAGFESTRTTFWGSPEARRLGLTLLPRLAEGDIWAEGDELKRLGEEIEILHQSLSSVCNAESIDYWQFRISNVKEAIRVAKEIGGGVTMG